MGNEVLTDKADTALEASYERLRRYNEGFYSMTQRLMSLGNKLRDTRSPEKPEVSVPTPQKNGLMDGIEEGLSRYEDCLNKLEKEIGKLELYI